MPITVYHYDAFASIPGTGNPAGVVLDAMGLTDAQMQRIAAQIGFNETAFVLPSEQATLRLRFFTPGHEVNLCGHATVATLAALHDHRRLPMLTFPFQCTLETKAAILPLELAPDADGRLQVHMAQAPAQFVPFLGNTPNLARALGLEVADLAPELPIVFGSTGLWTLVVPVRGLAAMGRMRPDNAQFPAILAQMPHASVHPVCLETYDSAAQMHGRHFSSPFSGTIEDPVTGTASGVLGAYYIHYLQPEGSGISTLLVEQGQEIGRDGRVRVTIARDHDHYQVGIAGTACFVRSIIIEL
jgi:PhzF family phenazine biosynthesis protein